MTKGERAIDVFKAEWSHCETGIARYDTLIFQVRTWAVTVSAAMVAAAFSAHQSYIVLVGAVSPALFLFLDAQNKVFQSIFIWRSNEIQVALREYISEGEFSDESLECPSI